jgi:uncharacterized protein YwqG
MVQQVVAELLERLRKAGHSHLEGLIRELAEPGIRLTSTPTEADSIPLGASKFGGDPDLPPNMEWPRAASGPLAFVLQIRLEDVAPLDTTGLLPKTGWLAFFYDMIDYPWGLDPADLGGWRVMHFEGDPTSLVRTPRPRAGGEQEEEELEFVPATLKFSAEVTLPSEELIDFVAAGLEESAQEDYSEFLEEILPPEGEPHHHLLGHAQVIQHPSMALDCQFASHGLYYGDPSGYDEAEAKKLEPGASDWMLLLQLDTDDDLGFLWGDCGRLYFWIRHQDLDNRRFDKAWIICQCY